MKMDKPKENTNIYPYVNIHTPTDTQTYIHTDRHMHMYIYLIIEVRDSAFWNYVWKYLNYAPFKLSQASCSIWRDNYKKSFFVPSLGEPSLVSVLQCGGEFKNLIQIIKTKVIDKIVRYNFYVMINRVTDR